MRTAAIVLTTVTILACGKDTLPGTSKTPDATLSVHQKWAKAIVDAESVVLYEGLPHQGYDHKALEKDLKEKKTVRIHEFPFYAETLPLKENEATELKRLASDSDSYKLEGGRSKCGGFHPDYCIEWKKGDETYHVLVCFSCGEVKFFGPKIELYRESDDVRGGLGAILRPHRKNRTSWKRP